MDEDFVTFKPSDAALVQSLPMAVLVNAPVLGNGPLESRRSVREPATVQGRLAYGGLNPGLVGCAVLDMSKTGVRIETYIGLESLPEIFTVEICGVYNRARKCWVKERQMGLEFIAEDVRYLDAM